MRCTSRVETRYVLTILVPFWIIIAFVVFFFVVFLLKFEAYFVPFQRMTQLKLGNNRK